MVPYSTAMHIMYLFVGASMRHPTTGLRAEYKSEGSRGPVSGALLRPHPYKLLQI